MKSTQAHSIIGALRSLCLALALCTFAIGSTVEPPATANQVPAKQSAANVAQGNVAKININKAEAEELTKLPRVGPKIAERIIEFRKENGPFKKLEELMNVKGIGEKTFEKLKPQITL